MNIYDVLAVGYGVTQQLSRAPGAVNTVAHRQQNGRQCAAIQAMKLHPMLEESV